MIKEDGVRGKHKPKEGHCLSHQPRAAELQVIVNFFSTEGALVIITTIIYRYDSLFDPKLFKQ